jgi:hypothetical protein
MREPAARRSLDEIVEEAIEVIEHRRRGGRLSADARELFRVRMKDRIRRVQGRPPPMMAISSSKFGSIGLREFKTSLTNRLQKLREVRSAVIAVALPHYKKKPNEWLDAVETEIHRIEATIAHVERRFPERKGSKPLNPFAISAVRAAADLLDPSVERVRALSPFPDDPRHIAHYQRIYGDLGGACPWRQQPKAYVGGAWNELACLIYEALTGKPTYDLTRYCQKFNAARPPTLIP